MHKGAKRLNTFPGLHATRGSAGRSPLPVKEWEQLGLAETQVQQSNAHGVPAGPPEPYTSRVLVATECG